MKICILTNYFFPYVGGTLLVVHHLAEKFHQWGHQVSVLVHANDCSVQKDFPVSIAYHVQPIDTFGDTFSTITDEHLRYQKILEQNISQEMQRRGFDLIHAHSPYPFGSFAGQWGKKHHVPVVITCHGADMQQVVETDCELYFDLDKNIVAKTNHALKQGDIVTVPSRHLMESAICAGCPPEKIRLIPNGVDLKSFEEQTDYASDKTPGQHKKFILAMGRFFGTLKGFDLLLDAFSKVAKINSDIDLVIAGFPAKEHRCVRDKDEQAVKYRLLDFVLRHQLGQRVRFEPFMFGKQKIALFKNCLFFVCPSLLEGFGMVALEAMAAGKPVIAFNVGGIRDIVQPGVNGILVKPYDTGKLAEAMLNLMDNPHMQDKMSKAGKRIASHYDWSDIAQKHISVYNELLNHI